MREFSSYDKMLQGWMDDTVGKSLPRQARVVRSDGLNVWVRFVGESANRPEATMPTVVTGVPAGTDGWVIATAGGKGMFVPWGVPMVNSINPYTALGDAVSTTSIDANAPLWFGTDGIARNVTLHPGTWQFDLDASMFLRRNVVTGGWRLTLGVGDNRQTNLTYQVSPRDQFHLVREVWRTAVSVVETTVVPVRIGFCGWDTAGTTLGYRPTLTGTYKLIGGPS